MEVMVSLKLASARRFITEFAARRLALSLLVCNAGIMGGPRRVTGDGLEMQFQVSTAPDSFCNEPLPDEVHNAF